MVPLQLQKGVQFAVSLYFKLNVTVYKIKWGHYRADCVVQRKSSITTNRSDQSVEADQSDPFVEADQSVVV